jgi:hypothetical protein
VVEEGDVRAIMTSLMRLHEKVDLVLEILFGGDDEEEEEADT